MKFSKSLKLKLGSITEEELDNIIVDYADTNWASAMLSNSNCMIKMH